MHQITHENHITAHITCTNLHNGHQDRDDEEKEAHVKDESVGLQIVSSRRLNFVTDAAARAQAKVEVE